MGAGVPRTLFYEREYYEGTWHTTDLRHGEPHFRRVPVLVHGADFVPEVPRGSLNACPLLLGESRDGAVAVVARQQGLLSAHLRVSTIRAGRRRDGPQRATQRRPPPPPPSRRLANGGRDAASSSAHRRMTDEKGLRLGGGARHHLRHHRPFVLSLSPSFSQLRAAGTRGRASVVTFHVTKVYHTIETFTLNPKNHIYVVWIPTSSYFCYYCS